MLLLHLVVLFVLENKWVLCGTGFGTGANGKTGKEWKKLLPYLRSRLSTDCNVSPSIAFFFGKFRFMVLSVDEKKVINL